VLQEAVELDNLLEITPATRRLSGSDLPMAVSEPEQGKQP
jgi:hypothetical protein